MLSQAASIAVSTNQNIRGIVKFAVTQVYLTFYRLIVAIYEYAGGYMDGGAVVEGQGMGLTRLNGKGLLRHVDVFQGGSDSDSRCRNGYAGIHLVRFGSGIRGAGT